jgi:hypothetical protein
MGPTALMRPIDRPCVGETIFGGCGLPLADSASGRRSAPSFHFQVLNLIPISLRANGGAYDEVIRYMRREAAGSPRLSLCYTEGSGITLAARLPRLYARRSYFDQEQV